MLLQNVLELPTKKRAEIALRIMESLETGSSQDAEAAWASEVRDRVESLRAGKATTRPAAEIFETARRTLLDRR